jgi:DNA-directed RNA polymerase
MTTPYGVTKRSAIDYVIEDDLKHGTYPCFEKAEYMKAATVLMDAAWPAIGDVVVKGRECMEWLRKSARIILRSLDPEAEPIIHWTSPSGFVAAQAYYEEEVHRINTRLAGGTKIRMQSETDVPDSSRHASGLAPNFVHSMDAAHLHLTAEAAAAAGIHSLAMIHDDYGTHAANAQALFNVIRQQFVAMYEENDPIQEFKDRYSCIETPPEKGTLDIREVLSSAFFFS